jgi:archaellum component FlaC
MNKIEKEKLIVALRREGKNYREIAKEIQISIRDIKPILDKYGFNSIGLDRGHTNYRDDGNGSMIVAVSSRAYELFSEGQLPLEVSIALNIEGPKALDLHKEYLDLKHMGSFSKMYKDVGNDLPDFIKFYQGAKRHSKDIAQMMNYLRIFSDDLPAVQKQYEALKRKTNALQIENNEGETQRQDIENQVAVSSELLRTIIAEIHDAQSDKWELDRQKTELRRFVAQFRGSDQGYREIEQFVETRVKMILRDSNRLLDLAVISVLSSLCNDPEKCRYLFEILNLENNGRQNRKITSRNYAHQHTETTPLMKCKKSPFFFVTGLLGAQVFGDEADPNADRYKQDIVEMAKMFYEQLEQKMTMDIMKLLEP